MPVDSLSTALPVFISGSSAAPPGSAATSSPAADPGTGGDEDAEGAKNIGDKEKASTQQEAASEARKKCKNNLHAATVSMSDSTKLRLVKAIVVCVGPLRREHGFSLKSFYAGARPTQEWFSKMATGSWLQTLGEVWGVLEDKAVLERLGFFEFVDADALDEGDIAAEESMAHRLYRLVFPGCTCTCPYTGLVGGKVCRLGCLT